MYSSSPQSYAQYTTYAIFSAWLCLHRARVLFPSIHCAFTFGHKVKAWVCLCQLLCFVNRPCTHVYTYSLQLISIRSHYICMAYLHSIWINLALTFINILCFRLYFNLKDKCCIQCNGAEWYWQYTIYAIHISAVRLFTCSFVRSFKFDAIENRANNRT